MLGSGEEFSKFSSPEKGTGEDETPQKEEVDIANKIEFHPS